MSPPASVAFLPRLAAGLLLLVGLAGAQAPAEDAARRVAAFERAFRSTRREPRSPEELRAALESLAGLDDPSVAAALVRAWQQCAEEITLALEERLELEAEIADALEGRELGGRAPSAPDADTTILAKRSRALAAREAGLREVEAALGDALARLRSEPALGAMLAELSAPDELPFSLGLALAEDVGKLGEPAVAPLARALDRAKGAQPILVLLTALGACGKAAQSAAPVVVERLAHADPCVREQAAGALAKLASPAGIEPLVARLATERGHTRLCLAIALERLTGVALGTNVQGWNAWLAKEGARYRSGAVELGLGRSPLADDAADPRGGEGDPRYAAFYGIPQGGDGVVYVIDCSGSMVVSATDPRWADGKPVDAGSASRMEATKAALIEVLGKLGAHQRFGLVAFDDVVKSFTPAMLEARATEVKRAQTWVTGLTASGATNAYDALQEAFRLAGRGTRDRYYESAVDTIFLLTDGTPTQSDGQPDDVERIHAAVQAWNPLRHVVIHTIGIGRELNESFLWRMAQENGGRYVQEHE